MNFMIVTLTLVMFKYSFNPISDRFSQIKILRYLHILRLIYFSPLFRAEHKISLVSICFAWNNVSHDGYPNFRLPWCKMNLKRVGHFLLPKITLLKLVLYSQTKGVKQKYILCISGLVVYRQYIHNCSSQVDPRLAHGGESTICSSAPLAWLPLSRLASAAALRCGA